MAPEEELPRQRSQTQQARTLKKPMRAKGRSRRRAASWEPVRGRRRGRDEGDGIQARGEGKGEW